MSARIRLTRLFGALALAVVAVGLAGCGGGPEARMPSPGELDADRYLFERGKIALDRRNWLEAREYFKKLLDTYPGSDFRQDAKLGVGDAYLGEKRIDTDILAAAEFREFLRFYPLSQKADYAQYRVAIAESRQSLSPPRDQTATEDALREIDVFIERYPTSAYMPEVIALQRQMKDKLAEKMFLIGRQYYRSRWYPGTVSRMTELLEKDPQYIGRDGAYFYLAEALMKLNRSAEALPYYSKLVEEFKVSEYLKDAKQRIAAIERATATSSTPGGAAPAASAPTR